MDKQTEEVSLYQKKVFFWTMSSTLVLAIVLMIFEEKSVAKGLVLGACFSVLNFFLLGRFIPLTLGRSRAKARFISLTSILSRYALLAVPLISAVKLSSFDFVATVVGIFAVQIVLFVDHVYMFLISTVWKKRSGNETHARTR